MGEPRLLLPSARRTSRAMPGAGEAPVFLSEAAYAAHSVAARWLRSSVSTYAGDLEHVARILGAPVIEPQGNSARTTSTARRPGASRARTVVTI